MLNTIMICWKECTKFEMAPYSPHMLSTYSISFEIQNIALNTLQQLLLFIFFFLHVCSRIHLSRASKYRVTANLWVCAVTI